MSNKELSKIVLNAHRQELIADGHEMVTAFEMMEIALSEANTQGAVEVLIGESQIPEFTQVRTAYLELMISAFNRYLDADGQETLGQSFGLEGVESGTHRAISKLRTKRRNVDIAWEIQNRMEEGLSREQSIAIAAEQFHMSEDAVRKAIGPHNKNILKNALGEQVGKEKGR